MAARVTVGFLISCLLAFSACTHKPEMALNDAPTNGCDTVGITYAKDIEPIFSGNCYSCHGTAVTDTAGGLNLEDTVSLKNYLQLSFRGDGIYGSKLYHCMLHANLALPMPPTYIVDSCSLNKVQFWIKEGAPI